MLRFFLSVIGIIFLTVSCTDSFDVSKPKQNEDNKDESSLIYSDRGSDPSLLTPLDVNSTNTSWTWNSIYTKLEMDMKFEADPGNYKPLFVANQFDFVDANKVLVERGYIGLQSNMLGQGKGIMFSVWGATSATAGPGATCRYDDNEGPAYQCFMTYNWVANKTYRLKVVMDSNHTISGYVVDMSTYPVTETYVGQIVAPVVDINNVPRVPAGFGWLVQWVEWYAGRVDTCAAYPYLKVFRATPKANDGAVIPNQPLLEYGGSGYKCHNTYMSNNSSGTYQQIGNPGTSSKRYLVTSNGSSVVQPAITDNGCGGAGMKATSSTMDDCTALTRVALANGKVALQTRSGHFLSCTNGGGSTVNATSRTVGNYESFTESTLLGKVSYKSYLGRYLTAVNGGGSDIRCDAYFASTKEKFTPLINKAMNAAVTVSSESTATNQLGIKAIDGYAIGYPYDYTKEWAAINELVGAWIKLQWSTATKVSMITLHDRPNTVDHITAGTLTFSDGSSITVGELPNEFGGLNITFPAKNITWVKFTVDQASGAYIGLSEFQTWGN